MMNRSPVSIGWIGTSIHDFLSAIEEPPSGMTYTLITCLDSSFDIPSLLNTSQALEPLRGKCSTVGQGILVSTRQLLAAERRQRIFFGFDELWFLDRRVVEPKPKELVITGPNRISEETVIGLAPWMEASGCSLGLGDGLGMNFCARLRGVARHLVEILSELKSEEQQSRQATA